MKKIVFGITRLDIGGAEYTLVDVLNNLVKEYDITLFTIYGKGKLESRLDKKIKINNYTNKSYDELTILERKIIALRFKQKPCLKRIYNKFIKDKFETEVAFLEGPITNLFSIKSTNKKIAWVHTDLSKHYASGYNKYANFYTNYDKIIFVSKESLEGFESIIKNDVSKTVIHNYLDEKRIIENSNAFKVKEDIDYLVIARLTEAKGLNRLIEVVNKLIKEKINIKIHIIGDGEEKPKLITLINQYNLQDNIILLGSKENVYPYLKKCQTLLIPSLYEGYSLVAVEGMILSKRIISTDTGAKEVLNDYSNKVIVDNSFEGLYDELKKQIPTTKIKTNYKIENTIEKIKEIL